MSGEIRINLHPDTGHHYARIRIRDILDYGSDHKNEEMLDTVRERLQSRAEQLRRWQSWGEIEAPWLRYSYELEDTVAEPDPIPVLCLAIETNLGDAGRNWPLDQPNPSPDMLSEAGDPPYIAEDERKLGEKTALAGEAPVKKGEKDPGGFRYTRLTFLPGDIGNYKIDLVIYFKIAGSDRPIETDLVVDLGNTRLLALLVEAREASRQGNRDEFSDRVRPVWFTPRNHPFEKMPQGATDEYSMVDSWMLLIESPFAHLEPPVCFSHVMRPPSTAAYPLAVPHMFMEVAPGQLGGGQHPDGALKLYGRAALENHLFSWSSPKRYAWADDERESWSQMSPSGEGGQSRFDPFHEVRGLLRYLMSTHGASNDLDLEELRRKGRLGSGLRPALCEKANFALSDTICWFALAILEAAWRQVNDQDYQEVAQQDIRVRRLRDIYVTFPAGWVWEERERYFAQWKRAIRLFSETRFVDPRPIAEGGMAPQLVEHAHDEAVCSQVPVLYSHFRRFRGEPIPWRWFHLYGRFEGDDASPADGEGEARVMNIDIGGGTTDNAVIRYGYDGSRSASAKLLFKDSNSVAGDAVVKAILEQVLLPRWLRVNFPRIARVIPEATSHICNLFGSPRHESLRHIDGKAEARIKRALRLLFIPLVNRWLGMLARLENPDAELDELVLETSSVDLNVLDDLNALFVRVIVCLSGRWLDEYNQPPLHDTRALDRWVADQVSSGSTEELPLAPPTAGFAIRLKCTRQELEACIESVFKPLLPKWAQVLARYRCDLVILSGKPSEIPFLQRLILRHLPVLPQRFVQMKQFNAGQWYPTFAASFEGEVTDAKTCTAVGAAALQDGLLKEFRLDSSISSGGRGQTPDEIFEWCRLSNPLHSEQAGNVEPLFESGARAAKACPEEGDGAIAVNGVVELRPGEYVGRRIAQASEATVEPVYEFRVEPMPEPGAEHPPIPISVDRVVHPRKGEYLRLPETKLKDGRTVRLKLNTLRQGSFWMNAPRLKLAQQFHENAVEA